jgi:hypothetical protein
MSSILLLVITIGFFILCNIFIIFSLKKIRAKPTDRRVGGIKGKIRNKIENIVQVKMLFILPKSIILMYNDLMKIEKKLGLLRKNIKTVKNNIQALKNNRNGGNIDDIFSKQGKYYSYLGKYYDEYCSLYTESRFNFYIILVKDILINKNKIYTVDVNHFIETIENDMEFTRHTLTEENNFDQCLKIIDDAKAVKYFLGHINDDLAGQMDFMEEGYAESADIDDFMEEFEEFKNQLSNKTKRQQTENDILFKKLNKTIDGIKAKIKIMATDLITVQSRKTIRNTSPIDEENALNKYKQKNNLEMVIEHSMLDDEYDRFMAEIELFEN